jgi:hypothetical protein
LVVGVGLGFGVGVELPADTAADGWIETYFPSHTIRIGA